MHIVAFGNASPMTRTQKIMYLLVESGIAYMLFFVSSEFLRRDRSQAKTLAHSSSR